MKVGLAIAFVIAIAGQVAYHVTQKSVAPGTHPVVSLLAFYAVAAAFTLPLFWWFPLTTPIATEVGKLNWAVYGVAASIVLIEIGFLLVYRAGAELSSAFTFTSATVAVATLLVGVAFFREPLSVTKMLGIIMCLGGIALLTWKPAT
jgi:drug/metabolite transporter (DMT)-like permease